MMGSGSITTINAATVAIIIPITIITTKTFINVNRPSARVDCDNELFGSIIGDIKRIH